MKSNRLKLKPLMVALAILALPFCGLSCQAASGSSSGSAPVKGDLGNKNVEDLLQTYKKNREGGNKKEDGEGSHPFKLHKSASAKRIVFHSSTAKKSSSSSSSSSSSTTKK
jgi:hypothetical protein